MRRMDQMSVIQPQSRIAIFAATLILPLAMITSGCNAKQDLVIQDRQLPEIQLVVDSSAVRLLISHEEAVEKTVLDSWQKSSRSENAEQQLKQLKDVNVNPEQYTPGRSDFLMAMQQQPAVVVHGQAHVAIVRTSLAACTLIPFATDNFVNVRVLEGSDRGKEGWLCSKMISVNDAKSSSVADQAKGGPAIKTTLCDLVTGPDTYNGRVVEIRAVVEHGDEVSLLIDSACSARIWFDTSSADIDEEQYRRIEAYLLRNNGVSTVVGRFDHVGWFSFRSGHGFGHLGQWQSQLVLQSLKGIEAEQVVPKAKK